MTAPELPSAFSIPAYSGDEAPAQDAGAAHVACHQHWPERSGDFMKSTRPLVSVVDDDESVRESLPDLLKELGFAVQAFSSAEEFLASDTVGETRCLILDVAMPGMTGPDLQRELMRRGHRIPIVYHHSAQGRDRPAAPDRAGRSRLPVQAVQRCRSSEGAHFSAQLRLTVTPCHGQPCGDTCDEHGSGDCTRRQREVRHHAARNTDRVRRRRRYFGARIAGAADPLRGMAATRRASPRGSSCRGRGHSSRTA